MTKEHLIGRIARDMRKSSFDNAEDHFKCAEDLSKISIEYAISVLELVQQDLMNKFMTKSVETLEDKIQELKSLIS